MPSSNGLASAAAVLGVLVAMLVDGRRAPAIAAVAVALGLAPGLGAIGGGEGLLVLAGAAAAAVAGSAMAALLGRRPSGARRLNPSIPVFAPANRLFGSRSARLVAAALGIPVASWVSSNVSVGAVAAVSGLLFPAAYAWTCGAFRLLLSRSIVDLAAGMSMVALGAATAWQVRAGADAVNGAAVLAGLAPAAAMVAGWLEGRSARGTLPRPTSP